MVWARFDDGYLENPKVEAAGALAEHLDMRAIIYCARNETDGLVTERALKRIGMGLSRLPERVLALVAAGRWVANDGGGWLIHDFLEFNPSKAQLSEQRARGRERTRKHRSNASRNGVTGAYQSTGRDGISSSSSNAQKIVSRCKRCDRLSLDCECPPLAIVEDGSR